MDEGASFWEVSFIFGVVMKKFFLILLSSLLVLSSCSTTERAYSFSSSDGIRVFLRPVKLKGELPVVLDLTIPTEKSKITGDATLNYSLYTKKGTIKDIESLSISFSTDKGKFETEDNELLFVEGNGKDEVEIRFTSKLPLSSTLSLMESGSVEVSLIVDSNTYPLDSSLFISSLENAKGYLL